ncbi:MAG: hypothetical protein ACD_13C00193G0008 [uncultured bacterium]|nr:MAG: hypothetical protein ACD_13C00193G0008 [uncultured bacterium]
MSKAKFGKNILNIFTLIIPVILAVLAFFLGKEISGLQSLGYLGVLIANLIGSATIVLPAPSFASTIAVGALLNPALTATFSAFGSTIGELTGYFLGRGGGKIVGTGGKNIGKIKKWIGEHGLWVVFVLAVIPNPLFDLAGFVSGASHISVWKYLAVVFAGKLIKFFILAYTGFGILKFFNLAF